MRNLIIEEPEAIEANDVTHSLSQAWRCIRLPLIVPLLRLAIIICAIMSVMLFIERVYMATVIFCVKVYKLSIGAACGLSWLADRFIIQILDDSTNEPLREMVELECHKWMEKGVNVKYETRGNRNGYKAGALREGLQKEYVKDCEFVVIFDADFQPDQDFLWRTIPYLLKNPELGLVQARWKFVNADECLMTRLQEMSLDYHFSVEQEVGSSTCSFFGFNGRQTGHFYFIQDPNNQIIDAGRWKDRTTVEDMDLAVRASLKGWKFIFVGDLAVSILIPSINTSDSSVYRD
ncbi:Glycosyltransferase 2-like [Dillenia turbinata]|uniref:glucomannan 4-beta-mannosyltransferase n=1 Tax=Dillenia turbinata TaxID=194707 RepID=A0AAN8ZQ93_9MAGN